MRNIYMVVTRRKDIDGQAKYYVQTTKVAYDTENLLHLLRDREICDVIAKQSRRAASKETRQWNEFYKIQGKYLEPQYW